MIIIRNEIDRKDCILKIFKGFFFFFWHRIIESHKTKWFLGEFYVKVVYFLGFGGDICVWVFGKSLFRLK